MNVNSKHSPLDLDFPVVLEDPERVKNTALKRENCANMTYFYSVCPGELSGKATVGVSFRTVCIGGIQLQPHVGLTFFPAPRV